jgi:hypothetical protein
VVPALNAKTTSNTFFAKSKPTVVISCPQGVDDLSALAYQNIARAMLHQLTLLFGRFDPHEASFMDGSLSADWF